MGPDRVLHTNLDAVYLVDHGTPAEVEAALAEQVEAAGGSRNLICSLGSEVTVNTPPANLDALIAAAHAYAPLAASSSPG